MPGARITWNDPVPAVRASAHRGINLAGEYLLGRVKPRTPHLGGDLEERTTWEGVSGDSIADLEQGGQIQSDTEYAVYQHEGMRKDGSYVITQHTHEPNPAAGTKFVEGPLEENRDTLYGIIAGSIAQGLG
jgi:hypothetical protein